MCYNVFATRESAPVMRMLVLVDLRRDLGWWDRSKPKSHPTRRFPRCPTCPRTRAADDPQDLCGRRRLASSSGERRAPLMKAARGAVLRKHFPALMFRQGPQRADRGGINARI